MAGVVLAWRRVDQDIDGILLTVGFLWGVEALEVYHNFFGETLVHCLARDKKLGVGLEVFVILRSLSRAGYRRTPDVYPRQ